MKIAVVDYKMGNIGSVVNAINSLGYDAEVADSPAVFRRTSAIILPGVGAFRAGMKNLRSLGLIDVLSYQVNEKKKPFLGICLGMQLLANSSEEFGICNGLGWIDGAVKRLDVSEKTQLPHVGWNELNRTQQSDLFLELDQGAHAYFDHSYHLVCGSEYITSTVEYNGTWTASLQYENIFATQFHPEKSQRVGLKMLRNFLNYVELH